MTCPSCNSPLEPTARFCGVCGYRLQAKAAPAAPGGSSGAPRAHAQGQAQPRPITPVGGSPQAARKDPASAGKPQPRPPAKPRTKEADPYLNQTLNNRFHVESKIGEGGFGSVYRGVQLATGRKVALKLLHPDMTKDENLVARFRREGKVLCNLRDAHTITTYDFDQTPEGTLYIAMEMLEGKSLHQVFHEQQPLEWKRMFKILTEMCSSLAEAHQLGIVHRDLKPENVYLESRPGNPEFVKILDFGIAKVMRGETIDPQSPQLTATGQTLGTLEYMSPEQLMGKALDGRSDVYALGVVAYELITGRLPFPDAKGPAGLITAQLKQTPDPPSKSNPSAGIPPAADRVILKCLEKDKNNRYADVTQLSNALHEVIVHGGELAPPPASPVAERIPHTPRHAPELVDTRRGDPPVHHPPPMPLGSSPVGSAGTPVHHAAPMMHHHRVPTPPVGAPILQPMPPSYPQIAHNMQGSGPTPMAYPQAAPYQQQLAPQQHRRARSRRSASTRWVWWMIGLLALGAAAGAVVALLMGSN